jgi:hypothetical protein
MLQIKHVPLAEVIVMARDGEAITGEEAINRIKGWLDSRAYLADIIKTYEHVFNRGTILVDDQLPPEAKSKWAGCFVTSKVE